MFKNIPLLISSALLLTACSTILPTKPQPPFQTPMATGYSVRKPVQCVPYAREMSGVQIYGDAYTWWDKAARSHARGCLPQPGAVLVLSRTPRMTHGHVAVVKDVLGPREINVTHSNWGNDPKSRRVIYSSVRVQDISAANDWTRVRFWNPEVNNYGFPYIAKGFIYR